MFDAKWHAVQREGQLAAENAAHGVTMLGRANHAQTGLYTQAFFGLSIGLERAGKLIFLVDYAIRNNGNFPTDQDLRKIGHDLSSLLGKCEEIGTRLDPKRSYSVRPKHAIHLGIETVVSLFATKLRYYNLNQLAGVARGQRDPITLWWESVAVPICDLHYSPRQRERDATEGAILRDLFGANSLVLHSTEAGAPIQDLQTFFSQGRATRIAQRYGQFYALQIMRWLSSMIFELSRSGAYEKGIDAVFGLDEPFSLFLTEDRYLRDRKIWSIYPR